MIKKFLLLTFLTVVVFAACTVFTSKIETAVDGHDTIGFPFTFYIAYGGKCAPCPSDRISFNLWMLMLDIGVSLIGGLLIWKMVGMVRWKGK